MRYIKKQFHINTAYMRVEYENSNFYKGLLIGFDLKETKLENIYTWYWLEFKSSKHLIEEISKEEFDNVFNKAIEMLNDKK